MIERFILLVRHALSSFMLVLFYVIYWQDNHVYNLYPFKPSVKPF